MLNRRLLLAAAVSLPLAGAPAAALAAKPLDVVASFSILGDIVKEIGKDHVRVTILVGPDGDAHVYEPTPADTRKLTSARVLVVNGLDFEGWLPRLVAASGFKGRQVVASEGVTPRRFDDQHEKGSDHADDHADKDKADGHDHHDHGTLDPHAWQDLGNGVIYARNIATALAAADPANAIAYQANAAKYIDALEALDARVKAAFAKIPAERRKVVTSHDAFGYFGAAYSIAFIAPTGVSTEAEASAGDVARIIDQIRAEHIPAAFVENITNPRLLERMARETGAKIGGRLYSDALSGPNGPASTYVKMFEWNMQQLVKGLGTS